MGECYSREKDSEQTKPDFKDMQHRLNAKYLEYESKREYKVEGESPEDQLVSLAANMRLLDSKTSTVNRGRVNRVAQKYSNYLAPFVAQAIKNET